MSVRTSSFTSVRRSFMAAYIPAPRATTVSGLPGLASFWPSRWFKYWRTTGILQLPPTGTTACSSLGERPLSFKARSSGVRMRLNRVWAC